MIEFADGKNIAIEELLINPVIIVGDNQNNYLSSTKHHDYIMGYEGNDTLVASNGNDTLIGGLGNDLLIGDLGDDVYIFNLGDGQDTISNFTIQEEFEPSITYNDGLVFGENIYSTDIDVELVNNGLDLKILINKTNDSILLKDYLSAFALKSTSLDYIKFNNGDIWTSNDIVKLFNDAPILDGLKAELPLGVEDAHYIINLNDLLKGYTDPNGDKLVVANLSLDYGKIINSKNGSYTIALPKDFYGVVNLSYQILDGRRGFIDVFNSFMVSNINDTPKLINDQALLANVFRGQQTTTISMTELLQGFYDIDGDTLIITNLIADHAIIFNNNDGTYNLILEKDYEGIVTLNYQIIDNQGGSVSTQLSFFIIPNTTGSTDADILQGGNSDDLYIVNHVRDLVIEADVNGGIDTVESTLSHNLGNNLENLVLVGSGNLSGAGNVLDNMLQGNDGNNRLLAGMGNDTLNGGAGSDTLNGGSGADVIYGGTGNDTFTVENVGDAVVEFV